MIYKNSDVPHLKRDVCHLISLVIFVWTVLLYHVYNVVDIGPALLGPCR